MKKTLLFSIACILLTLIFPVKTLAGNQNAQFMVEDKITDVNDQTFTIARPNPNTLNKVNAAQFGFSSKNEDNYTAFSSAINYCKEHPNTYLEISKGIYHFRMKKDIDMNGLNNILIDGNGSEFIFSTPNYFKINQCNSLEIRELAVEWDWESSRLASLVRIYKCNKIAKTFEIEFMELDDVDINIPIICFMQFDKDTLTPGSYGGYKTFYPDQVENGIIKRERVAPNRIKLYFGQEKCMDSFHNEEVYLIRHYTYGGRVFQPTKSENITFDDIHIYSAAGMGYIIGDKTKYFQIINSSIGRRTDRADAPYISTTADGIHILNTGGYFRIENCDFSFTGDDIINIHDDVMSITKRVSDTVFKGKVTGGFVSVGDKVSFKNAQMGLFEGCEDIEVEVAAFSRDPKTYDATITLKEPVSSVIRDEGFIYRTSTTTSNYVIKNNYIHETKGRAMLVLGSNALVENNNIYRTVSEGIHVLADVASNGDGSQGAGVSNVILRGNTLTECTVSEKKPVVMVSFKKGDTKSKYKDVLTNIKLEDNKFIGCYVDAIEADNTTNLYIKNNLIQDSGKLIIGEHCSNVTNIGNTVVTTTHLNTHDVILIQGRAPSCVSYGMKPIQYCNDCHRKLTGVIGIKPIDHNPGTPVIINKIEATCGEAGSYVEVTYCTECEQELTREEKEIAATGNHDFSKFVSNGDGTHKVVCKECGAVLEGHDKDTCSGGKATCTRKAKCTKCGKGYGKPAEHTLKTTTITKATLSSDGKKETKCTVCGKVTKTTKIYAAKTIKLSKTTYTYDGKAKKPAVTVKDSNGKAIAASNYTIEYDDGRKNVGKYNVNITFKGDYKGSKTLSFTINPKATTLKSVTPGSRAFTATWSKQTAQVDGYEIQYAFDQNFTSSAKKIAVNKNTTTSKTISNLKSKNTYYVRVRTYKKADSQKYYSDWSSVVNVKTK